MKTKVRNILLLSMALILVFASCLALFGCGDGDVEVEGADYTITFDENYKGGSKSYVGVFDGELAIPSDPEREGYMFTGWYTDKNGENQADFDEITEKTTVYAGWVEREEGKYYVTLAYNLEGMGTYKVAVLEKGDAIGDAYANSNPSVSGYKFIGWYYDSACTQSVSRLDDAKDATLYAYWYMGHNFEAEDVDLSVGGDDSDTLRKSFSGFSENGNPTRSDNSASGGYYIGDMYVVGSYIEFEITSTKAVSDASLSIRAALDYGWFNSSLSIVDGNDVKISSSDFGVFVNGTAVSYTTMTFAGAVTLASGERTAFVTYDLCNISLKEGSNTIKLETLKENKGQGGTQYAAAPLVDYITVYVPTDVTLTMKTYANDFD